MALHRKQSPFRCFNIDKIGSLGGGLRTARPRRHGHCSNFGCLPHDYWRRVFAQKLITAYNCVLKLSAVIGFLMPAGPLAGEMSCFCLDQ